MPELFESRDATATDGNASVLLAAIVDSSNDAIISKNLDGTISSWNAAAEKLFGYSAAEAIGQPLTMIIPPELHDEEQVILTRVRARELVEHFETQRVTRDGRLLDVSITVSPICNAESAVIGASKILRDISEDKRVHIALRESERRLASELARMKTLQSISTRLISERTQESLFAQLLDAAIEIMGADAASVQMLVSNGQSLRLLGWKNFHPASATFWDRVTAEAGSTCGVALRDNTRVHVVDVESCAFMAGSWDLDEYRRSHIRAVQSTPLQTRMGQPLGMLSTHWHSPHTPTDVDFALFDVLARQAADLIERFHAETSLRESEERFRLVSNAAPVIIWMSDISKECTYLNQTWSDVTGVTSEAGVGVGWLRAMHPDDLSQFWDTYARAFDRRERFQLEFRLLHRGGDYRTMVATGAPRFEVDGEFVGYVGCYIDLTERRQAEEALATIKQRLLEAQDEERTRIARELHDDVSQRLAVLVIDLDSTLKSMPASKMRMDIQSARGIATDLARDVRNFSHHLHPTRLEYLGIVTAAASLCHEMGARHHVQISFRADGTHEGSSKRLSLCMYRVLQEVLQNAVKHGGATRILVALHRSSDEIELSIQDDGAGFNADADDGFGLGLMSMRERVTSLGGQLAIETSPTQGTTIRASVPLAGNYGAADTVSYGFGKS